MFSSGSITVITAATGHPNLPRCLDSVQAQTFTNLEHLVVIDGPERETAVRAALGQAPPARTRKLLTLPHATGKESWLGHRIYGAMSLLCNTELVAFLDEDNWLDPEHFETLYTTLREQNALWGYSLRKLWSLEGDFVAYDKCESLGGLHPVFNNPDDFLIDTSCYLLHRELAAKISAVWYRPGRPVYPIGTKPPPVPVSPDRMICRALLEARLPAGASRKHTLNYTLGNRGRGGRDKAFLRGNLEMSKRYPEGMPWEKT